MADEPTAQKIFLGFAPFARITLRPDVVVSVDAIWKIHTAFSLPCPSSVRFPDDIASEDVDLYNPGTSVCPPIFPATVIAFVVRPIASLYAVVRSVCACAVTGPGPSVDPLTNPGGKPVIDEPGSMPIFPSIVPPPVLVIVCAARISKFPAELRFTVAGDCENAITGTMKAAIRNAQNIRAERPKRLDV